MARNPNAALSPAEVNALRRADCGLANHLSLAHRELLISMSLVSYTFGGRLVVTEAGKQRLREEEPNTRTVGNTPR